MSRTKGHLRRALLVVVVVIGASLFPTAANAQFPGDNGELAFGRLSPNGPDGIATMPEPGGQSTLISHSRGFDRDPSYTADGTRLLFVRKVDVWTMNADGSDAEKITDSRAREFCPSWSPDGTTIVFDRAGDLWTVELGAPAPHRLTRTKAREFCPSWSPDGTTIAFVLDGRGPNKFDIALMDADGSDRRRVTADRETQFGPDWSPDGTRIAYTNYDEFGFTSISTIGADGSDGLVVFDAGDRAVSSPVYSPDGLWIAFARDSLSGESSDIWVVESEGGGATRATFGRPYDVSPGWQPVAS